MDGQARVVRGVDLGGRRPDAVRPDPGALPEYEVLAFRDQRLDDEAPLALAGRPGPLTPGGCFFGDPGVRDQLERAVRTVVEQAAAAGIACGAHCVDGAQAARGACRSASPSRPSPATSPVSGRSRPGIRPPREGTAHEQRGKASSARPAAAAGSVEDPGGGTPMVPVPLPGLPGGAMPPGPRSGTRSVRTSMSWCSAWAPKAR